MSAVNEWNYDHENIQKQQEREVFDSIFECIF